MRTVGSLFAGVFCACCVAGCGAGDSAGAYASVMNDFNNSEMTYQPPWTICRASYLGVEFGSIAIGNTSAEQPVEAGIDNVLMVAAWDDPSCDPANALPIASANAEEIVPGQHRTITIGVSNHKGPCPPEGVEPISQELYERILALWPEFGFLPYDQRTQNTPCLE